MQLSQQQLESYQKNGFLILENYFSYAELNIIKAELPRLFAEDTPRRILERSPQHFRSTHYEQGFLVSRPTFTTCRASQANFR